MNLRRIVLPFALALMIPSAMAVPLIVTHDLSGLPSGSYALSFGLTDASGGTNLNSLVRISDWSGPALTVEPAIGNVIGNPFSGTLELRDTDGLADWAATFTLSAPTTISFVLDFAGSGQNDYFVYRLYREGFAPVSTTGTFGVESIGALATATGWAAPVTFAGIGSDAPLSPPSLRPVPEPASLAVLGLGVAAFRRSRKGGRR